MSENRSKLIEAAITQFSRYGVKRTSMASVAEEASLSRQTLYSIFPGKDELLAAAMNTFVDQILSNLQEEWGDCSSVEDTLNAYCKHVVYAPFKMLQKSPDLRDLLHGVGEHTKRVAVECDKRKSQLLADKLTPFDSELQANGSSPLAIASFIVKTTTEFKYSVGTRKELEKLLETLSQSVCALARGAG